MQPFAPCPNIVVDGDEFTSGFLGLDWIPSASAAAQKRNYESDVTAMLTRLMGKFTGWAVINEIFYMKRKMYIRPFHPSPTTGLFGAYAQADSLAGATMKDTTVLVDGKLPRDKSGNPLPPSARIIGTGAGSGTTIRFSPGTFAPGSGAPVSPGSSPDEVLLHEMVHGLRQMAGRQVLETVEGNSGMDNYEEFVAILVSNVFRSECRVALRKDHRSIASLTGPDADPVVFKTTYQRYLSYFDIEQPRLCQNLRQVRVAFNPLI